MLDILQNSVLTLSLICSLYFGIKALVHSQKSLEVAAKAAESSKISSDAAKAALDLAHHEIEILRKQLEISSMSLIFSNSMSLILSDAKERSDWVGISISHYSHIYALLSVHDLSDEFKKPLVAEIRKLFDEESVRAYFDEVRSLYTREFQEFVDSTRSA